MQHRIILAILSSLLILSPQVAHSQEQKLDLTISPPFFEFSTEKGATITDKIRVRNNSANPVFLKVSLQSLAPGSNSEVALSDPKPGDEFVSWLTIKNQTITARSREWTDIPFTIKIPDTAAFGYYFAFLISQVPSQAEGGNAEVVGGVAVPILLNVSSPGAIVQGELLEFKPKAFINEYLPVEFTARVENRGNVHIKPRGNIFIRGVGGKDLTILEINQELGSVLPGGQRSFDSSWIDGFLVREPTENGKTKLTINWNKLTEFRFGPYTGHLLMVYDDGTRDVALETTTSFWVIPYKVIAGTLVGLLIAAFVIRKLLKSYVASELRKRQS